jgi:hypothetical protein
MAELVLSAGRLCAGFEHRGDRYRHWIAIAPSGSGGQAEPWLVSIEGTASQTWPASPALQSLHVEEREKGVRVALLVGMAGGSHWSMSVEADEPRGELTFDVACRTRDVPEFLGSSYQAVLSSAEKLNEGHWRLCLGDEWIELELDGSAGEARADWQSDRLIISPELITAAGAKTHRWRYRLRHSSHHAPHDASSCGA